MIAFLQSTLGPYYLYIKFVHLVFVAIWVFSTSVAYAFYVLPVFKAWRRNPQDKEIIIARNWVMERFDEGALYEHVALPIVLLTGPLLFIVGGWSTAVGWLCLKLLIVVGLFIPIEACDYYLAHFGGSKARFRKRGDAAGYEKHVRLHWWFFLVTTPPVMVYGIVVMFLAITKPF